MMRDIPPFARFTAFSFVLVLTLFIRTLPVRAADGETLFLTHCAECHGENGDGRGPVGAYLEEQRPADLHALETAERTDSELFDIIKHGVYFEMPSWEGVLSDQQIQKIVEYLRILAPPLTK